MIGMACNDLLCAVELLHEESADHEVGPSGSTKGYFFVGVFVDFRGKSIGSSNQEAEMGRARNLFGLDELGERGA